MIRTFTNKSILLAALLLPLSFSSCSGSQIEKLDSETKSAKNDITDIRTLLAQHSTAINDIRGELRSLSGKIEEMQHSSSGKTQELEQTISQLKSRVPPPPGVPEDLLNSDEEKIAHIDGAAADQFKKGLSQIRAGDFDGSKLTLTSFISSNPGTAFTDNAMFWLGISHEKLGETDRAIVSFSDVFQKYPAEDMVAPALYFAGDAFLKLGSKNDAIAVFQKLLDEQKNSSYASRAKARLEEIQGPPSRKRNR